MIHAIIFDFDGTIVDTESLWFQVFKEILEHEYKIELPLQKFAKCIGTTDDALFEYIQGQSTEKFNHDEFMLKAKKKMQSLKKTLVLREGVHDLICEIKSLGLKLGIASSSSRLWVEEFLIIFNLHHLFDVIKTSEDVQKVKPDPSLYTSVVETLGINPNEAIAIEDSVNGSLSAIRAGIKCIVIPNQVTNFLTFPEEVIRFDDFFHLNIKSLVEHSKSN
ncbi:HAD family hydrolase [Lysinibacillus sphaericus]|uniref:HAD family hydrolase n=1 Tax=Lysinibacillus sphaericus TaxID=1421 RepID=A0A544UIH3_LYSSH|nr:HAD family hydrolase [Lysinibacillus sp. SDF0037]TQR32835.1 HAD family hydrolase [Lysinibacillus sp. SDF0037]